jgi:heptaprenylglyceryl phosphate synthase
MGEFMSYWKHLGAVGLLVGLTVGSTSSNAQEVKKVFVIAMENHNWTQPANQFTGGIQQIYQNPNAPFINSLVNGTAMAIIDGAEVNISQQVAYAKAYHNVLATPDGNNPDIHPSEPNYIWAEAGTNFGVASDADPYRRNEPRYAAAFDHFANESREDMEVLPGRYRSDQECHRSAYERGFAEVGMDSSIAQLFGNFCGRNGERLERRSAIQLCGEA